MSATGTMTTCPHGLDFTLCCFCQNDVLKAQLQKTEAALQAARIVAGEATAERDEALQRLKKLTAWNSALADTGDQLMAQRDQLRAENDRLKARIAWLRQGLTRIRDRSTEWFQIPLESQMALGVDSKVEETGEVPEFMRIESEQAAEYAARCLAKDEEGAE